MKRFTWAVVAIVFCASGLAGATEPKPVPHNQSQDQSQNQNQANAQTVTAGGGQGGGASNQFTEKSTAIALANGAPIPPTCPAGLIPGRHGKRGLNVLAVSLSAVCVAPGEAEAAAMQVVRDHELALAKLAVDAARAEAERDRAAVERISAESCRSACVAK